MKRTQITDLLSNIKATFVSFFSILMFVTLGVAVFLGISWAAPALQNAADDLFAEGAFHNLQIQYTYGLTDDDLEKLAEVEGVSQVEAERQSFETIRINGQKRTVKVQSLGGEIDTPIVVEGELPTKPGEIAFHADSASELNLGPGDVVTFEEDADASDDADALLRRSFTITALVNSAEYAADASGTYGFSTLPSGAIDSLAWVVDDAFDASAFQDAYPIANVRCDDLTGLATFSGNYKTASKEIEERVKELGETLSRNRFEEVRGDAQEKIDDAQEKLDSANDDVARGEEKIADGKQDIADGEQEIADGEAEIADSRSKIADGESDLEKARSKFKAEKARGQKELDAAAEKLKGPREKLRKAEAEYRAAKKKNDALLAACKTLRQKINAAEADYKSAVAKRQQYEKEHPPPRTQEQEKTLANLKAQEAAAEQRLKAAQSTTIDVDGIPMTLDQASQAAAAGAAQLSKTKKELDAKEAELDAGQRKYDAAKAKFDKKIASGQREINGAESRLDKARAQVARAEGDIADAKGKLEEAKQELESMEKELEDAKAELADKTKELESAKRDFNQMESSSWSVMPRSHNGGAGEISMFSDVTNNLSISMAALFIIVGLLVSYFAISRIVAEQITQIGTKKALGFRQGEVTVGYLWYSGLAVVAGSILGGIVAFFVVEGIISSVLADMFVFGAYPAYFGWNLFLAIFAIEFVLVLGATYLACRRILKRHAVDLLRGPEPPVAKARFYEAWGIWEKAPLFIQTIVNNCVNDRRRVLSTIVGVAGCTALIVTAITLNNDVMKSYYRQYDEVYGFNAITYAQNEPEGAAENVESALEREGATTAQVLKKRYPLEQPNGEGGTMSVIVPVDEDAFNRIYHVKPTTGGALDLSADGAWVSQAYAAHFGTKAGDNIVVDTGDGVKHEVPILGFYEFWLTNHEMVVGKDYFEREFEDATPNAILTQTGDIALTDLEAALADVEGFDSVLDDASKQKSDFDTFSSVSGAVVFIYLILATLMAVVVLLNLNVMFIDEKRRELIVLMINGFSVKDARHYVSYDSILLTALGIIVGLALGCIMGSVTVASVEPVTGVFVKSIDAWAVVIGILGSTGLAIIMSLIALRRVGRFKLTDINRS